VHLPAFGYNWSCRLVGAGLGGVEKRIGFIVALDARDALHPHQSTPGVHNEKEFLRRSAQVQSHDIFRHSLG